jgi:Ca2+-binding EF-hand superfamily protein
LFKEFDHEGIDVLTISNIKLAMRRMGKIYKNEDVEAMLDEHNIPRDGNITF